MRRVIALLLLLPLVTVFHASAPGPVHRAARIDAGGLTVRAVRAGSGAPSLLFIHGFGESLVTWQGVFDRLARHHAALAVDVPGFGLADKPDVPYDFPSQLRRLGAVLDAMQAPVVVVGHSMGGQLAAGLALGRPDQVIAAVLIAPAGDSVGLAGLVDSVGVAEAAAVGWWEAARAWALPVHAPGWLDDGPLAGYDPLVDPAYRSAAGRVVTEFDFTALRDRFAGIRQPVLLLWGTLDPVMPYAVGVDLAERIPCAELVSFPRTLHRPQVAHPAEVAAAIEDFLARLGAPGSCPFPSDTAFTAEGAEQD
jgi:pimeloyl-ACP methyl ester carboxylesterase